MCTFLSVWGELTVVLMGVWKISGLISTICGTNDVNNCKLGMIINVTELYGNVQTATDGG